MPRAISRRIASERSPMKVSLSRCPVIAINNTEIRGKQPAFPAIPLFDLTVFSEPREIRHRPLRTSQNDLLGESDTCFGSVAGSISSAGIISAAYLRRGNRLKNARNRSARYRIRADCLVASRQNVGRLCLYPARRMLTTDF